MRTARLAVFLAAALGLSLHAAAQDEAIWEDADRTGWYDQQYDGERDIRVEEFEQPIGVDIGYDRYGAYDARFEYRTQDPGFDTFYGTADQGWFEL
jgi:hypothetical protein